MLPDDSDEEEEKKGRKEVNHRRRKKGVPGMMWVLVLAAFCYPGWLAYQAMMNGESDDEVAKGKKEKTEEVSEGPTIRELAREAGVDFEFKRDDEVFEVVALVEGEDESRKLGQALDEILVQQNTMAELTRKRDELEAAGESIDGVEMRRQATQGGIERNLGYLREKYDYSLERRYVLLPTEIRITKVLEGGAGEPAKTLKSNKAFMRFEEMRAAYTERFDAVTRAVNEAANRPSPKPVKVVPRGAPGYEEMLRVMEENAREVEKVPGPSEDRELMDLRNGLIADYGYDPSLQYRVSVVGSALYAR